MRRSFLSSFSLSLDGHLKFCSGVVTSMITIAFYVHRGVYMFVKHGVTDHEGWGLSHFKKAGSAYELL